MIPSKAVIIDRYDGVQLTFEPKYEDAERFLQNHRESPISQVSLTEEWALDVFDAVYEVLSTPEEERPLVDPIEVVLDGGQEDGS